MNCFICERTHEELPLLRLPLEVIWEEALLEIVGNIEDQEYVCLVCMGYLVDERFDAIEESLA